MRLDQELLQGAIDIHVHSSPSLFERMYDHAELAEHMRDAGLRAVVIKSHHLGTADRVHFVRKMVPGIDVFGSIVLNYAVGGLNPFAVDAAIKFGAKVIWMPTVDARHHLQHYGQAGQYGAAMRAVGGVAKAYTQVAGITVVDDEGRFLPQVRDILELVAEANIALSCGHLSVPEIMLLIREAKAMGVKKVFVDHPNLFFMGPIPFEAQEEMARAGAYINCTFAELSPKWYSISVSQMAQQIRRLGPDNVLLSTDLGQPHNPPPAEGLRILIRLLLEEGLSAEHIKTMAHANPARLLYE